MCLFTCLHNFCEFPWQHCNAHGFHTTKRGPVFDLTYVFNVHSKLFKHSLANTFSGKFLFCNFSFTIFHILFLIFFHFCFSTRLPAELIRHGGSLFVPLVWWLRGGQDFCSDRLPAVPKGDVHIRSEVLHSLIGLVCIGMTYFLLCVCNVCFCRCCCPSVSAKC